MNKPSFLVALTAILMGAFVAIGGYLAYYSKAYSYLQDDPKACMNCHVMKDAYDGWKVSSHRHITCNQCHTPNDFVGKYATKVEHGARHSYVFTFGDPQLMRLKESGEVIVTDNCVACHQTMVNSILPEHANERRCLQCHEGVAHGRMANRRR
ncbi:MAG: cytochrome c nitrite reductase small subunit [bacterium]|nr:cytochrome c nitrite reductase small subunit [bacterium]